MGLNAKGIIGIIAALGLIGGGWFYTSFDARIGGIFMVLSGIAFLGALLSNQIASFLKSPTSSGGGANLRYYVQAAAGVVLGFLPIIFSLSFGLSIATPVLSVAEHIEFIATVILAPIVEESFFLFFVPFLLGRLLSPLGKIGFGINVVGTSLIFAGYHWLAYGGVFSAVSDYYGAFVFRIIALLMVATLAQSTKFTVEDTGKGIIAAVIMHAMFNAYVVSQSLFIGSEVAA